MVEYDLFETRLGEFEIYETASSAESGFFNHSNCNQSEISDYVRDTSISYRGAAEMAHEVDKLMSKIDEGSEEYFRNVTGLLGYKIGANLSEEAESSDFERIAEDIYLQLSRRDNGILETVLDQFGKSELTNNAYCHSKDEITAHIEDSIWIGWIDEFLK